MSRIYTQIFSDNFHRPDEEPLDIANWTNVPIDPFPAFSSLAVVSNVCTADAIGSDGYEVYTGSPVPDNQYASAVIGAYVNASGNSNIEVTVRGSAVDFQDGYTAAVAANDDGTSTLDLFVGNVSVFSQIISVVNPGDVVRVEALGSNITYLYNNTIIHSIFDSTFTSGVPGLVVGFQFVQTDTFVTLFTTGGISLTPTLGTVHPGIYGGSNLATAFSNPHSFDLMQVINEGGKVVWNLTSTGAINTNPESPTQNSILGKFFGSSFVTAFPNPNRLDVLQVINEGGHIVFGVDANGLSYVK